MLNRVEEIGGDGEFDLGDNSSWGPADRVCCRYSDLGA